MGGFTTPTADTRVATVVVAAYNSLHPEKADYRCDGVDDHIEIQAALDSLPSTGGQVILLDGTFNVQSTIGRNISNITIRGQGKSTILTTSTADLTFFSFVGASGTELTGITIADMQIDGAGVSDHGIYFEYVDKSLIQNVCSRRHASGTGTWLDGIDLVNSDFNKIIGNTCSENGYCGIYLETSNNNIITGNTYQGNGNEGIYLYNSSNNIITGNTCQGNGYDGIGLESSSYNTVTGNTCQGNGYEGISLYTSNNNTVTGNTCSENEFAGIYLDTSSYNTVTGNTCSKNVRRGINLSTSNNNTVTGNTCLENGYEGINILLSNNNNTVTGNTCIANSQNATNTYDDIYVGYYSNYNNIQGNTCRAGTLTNKPRYGINIATSNCNGNLVTNNDLYNDGFGTGSFHDAGTNTVTAAGNRT